MIEAWEAKLAGDTSDAESRFAAARDLAAARGFRYLKAGDVARLPTEELLDRVESVSVRKGAPDPIEARAFLGGAPEPPITVSRALELYWTLAADRSHGKMRIPRKMGACSTRSWARIPRHRGQPFHASGSLADVVMGSGLTGWVKRFQCGGALSHALACEREPVGVME